MPIIWLKLPLTVQTPQGPRVLSAGKHEVSEEEVRSWFAPPEHREYGAATSSGPAPRSKVKTAKQLNRTHQLFWLEILEQVEARLDRHPEDLQIALENLKGLPPQLQSPLEAEILQLQRNESRRNQLIGARPKARKSPIPFHLLVDEQLAIDPHISAPHCWAAIVEKIESDRADPRLSVEGQGRGQTIRVHPETERGKPTLHKRSAFDAVISRKKNPFPDR
jgi:hypothetical protein